MPRPLAGFSQDILIHLKQNGPLMLHQLYEEFQNRANKKKIYDTMFRLSTQGIVTLDNDRYTVSKDANILMHTISKERDGVWKMVIFDIPETQRQIRNILRAKLVSLGFKKWQNSIWISPYTIAPEIEDELNSLAEQYFIRLIKTTDINYTEDLENMFLESVK
jgi:phenylacetic acid degradation operon negative regulatory protein